MELGWKYSETRVELEWSMELEWKCELRMEIALKAMSIILNRHSCVCVRKCSDTFCPLFEGLTPRLIVGNFSY